MTPTVLLVEDDRPLRKSIAQTLDLEGISVIEAGTYIEAKDHIMADFAGIVLTDVRLPGKDGFNVLTLAQKLDKDLPVIMLTGEGDVPMAVRAMDLGAFDFLEKPCHPDRLLKTLGKALEQRSLVVQNRILKSQLKRNDAAATAFPGTSSMIAAFRDELRYFAKLPAHVHVQGEEGSGKRLAAKALHEMSGRSGEALFHDTHLLSVQDFENLGQDDHANTHVFWQIDKATGAQQERVQKLLSGSASLKTLTTSSDPLDDLLGERLIKELYFTVNVAQLTVPPLRLRPEDAVPMFLQLIERYALALNKDTPTPSRILIAQVAGREWTNNLLELRSFAQRFVLGIETSEADPSRQSLQAQLEAFERMVLSDTLGRHGGVTAKVAEGLSVPLKTLYDRLARYGLKSSDFRVKGPKT